MLSVIKLGVFTLLLWFIHILFSSLAYLHLEHLLLTRETDELTYFA